MEKLDSVSSLSDLYDKASRQTFFPGNFFMRQPSDKSACLFLSVGENASPPRLLAYSIRVNEDLSFSAWSNDVLAIAHDHLTSIMKFPRKILRFSDVLNLMSF